MNHDVHAPEVRLIDEQGAMMGVMSSHQALKIAEDRNLDLIEVAPKATPPTCKIMDYGKWKYENKKKEKISKKKQTVIAIKEIQVRPRTEDHDLNTKLKHARRFLEEGSKVKINLRFSGREMAHQELGFNLLNKITKILARLSTVETPPKREGRQIFVLLAPDPAKMKELQKMENSLIEDSLEENHNALTEHDKLNQGAHDKSTQKSEKTSPSVGEKSPSVGKDTIADALKEATTLVSAPPNESR